MEAQNYKNHSRIVPMYHYVLAFILTACIVAAVWNMYRAWEHHSGRLAAVSIFGLCIASVIIGWYARIFAIVAQDRAIRAEENLRHFVLDGKLMDPKLTIQQVIALRFAADTEFLILSEKAATENMKPSDIKRAIVNWRPDNHRV